MLPDENHNIPPADLREDNNGPVAKTKSNTVTAHSNSMVKNLLKIGKLPSRLAASTFEDIDFSKRDEKRKKDKSKVDKTKMIEEKARKESR